MSITPNVKQPGSYTTQNSLVSNSGQSLSLFKRVQKYLEQLPRNPLLPLECVACHQDGIPCEIKDPNEFIIIDLNVYCKSYFILYLLSQETLQNPYTRMPLVKSVKSTLAEHSGLTIDEFEDIWTNADSRANTVISILLNNDSSIPQEQLHSIKSDMCRRLRFGRLAELIGSSKITNSTEAARRFNFSTKLKLYALWKDFIDDMERLPPLPEGMDRAFSRLQNPSQQ